MKVSLKMSPAQAQALVSQESLISSPKRKGKFLPNLLLLKFISIFWKIMLKINIKKNEENMKKKALRKFILKKNGNI